MKTTEQTNIEAEESPLNWKVVFYISLFLGFLGIDRFYVGKKTSGVLKLLTSGGLGIWWAVDLFLIATGKFTDASNRKIRNTSKRRTLALIFLAPIIMILIMSLMVSLFSSPEEREQWRVERAQKEAQKEAERELRKQAAETSEKPESDFTDPRDSKKYKTVKIGTQTWMAENLNYEADGSKCYDNNPSNCQKYGRLYNWNEAMKACPKGWHLPSRGEYEVLDRAVGGEKTAGKKLKAKSGWKDDGNGTDEFGFSALPGGSCAPSGSFSSVGGGVWWSASESDRNYAYFWGMYYDVDHTYWHNPGKSYLFSVRCLQD